MRTWVLSVVVIAALPALSVLASTQVPPSATATRASSPPAIDGVPDDAAWAGAPPIAVTHRTDGSIAPPAERTAARVVWDDHGLYVLVTVPPPRSVRGAGGPPFASDRVSVVLDAACEGRTAFVVDVAGTGAASTRFVGPPPSPAPGTSGVRATAGVHSASLVVEAEIPWACLGADPSWRMSLGLDLLHTRAGQPAVVTRWSDLSRSPEPDPTGTGVLYLDADPLRVDQVSWSDLHIGRSPSRALLTNTTSAPLRARLRWQRATPFRSPSSGDQAVLLAGAEQREFILPVECAAPGGGTLRFEAWDEATPSRCLYANEWPAAADGRFFVRGIGWMECVPRHRLAGSTPIAVQVNAVDCRPSPSAQPPVELSVSLHGPVGVGERDLGGEHTVLEPVALSVMRRTYTWPADDLLPGDYAVRVSVDRGAVPLAYAEVFVRVSRATEDNLGLGEPQRALAEIAAKGRADAGSAVHAGAASLAYRLDRAWRPYDTTQAVRAEDLRGVLDQVRAEAAEANRMASDLRAGHRPYQAANGTFLLAHWSRVDGTAQPYALYVPDTYADTRASGLVIVLHGYDGGNGGFGFPGDPNDAYKVEARKRGWLVLWPWGRGNQDWRDSGETDVVDLLAELERLYSIDRDRVYLAGISMGGRGVWHLAGRRPDLWAAAIPIAGASAGQVWSIWQEERLVGNLRNVPTYIVHGGNDPIVPVEDARTMYRGMIEAGYDVRYAEFATRGHEGFGDFVGALYTWMEQYRRNPWPRTVTYSTDWLRWSSAYWLRVEQLEREGRLGSVEATIADPSRVEVTTRGIAAFSVDLYGHPMLDTSVPTEFVVDGESACRVFLAPGERVRLRRDRARWSRQVTGPSPEGPVPPKSTLVRGPMRRIFSDSFRLIHGTRGWDEESILTAYDMARRTAERWNWWMWGNAQVLTDTEAIAEGLGASGAILYGGPGINDAARELLGDRVAGLDPAVAAKVAGPNRENPIHTVAVFTAPGARALLQAGERGEAWPLPPVAFAAQDADYQVARVDSEERLIPMLEGTFDNLWGWPVPEPSVAVVTDAQWKSTRTPAPGWTEPAYDDSGWRAPVVRFRKEFDDTCWHFAALHKYGRLGNSFSPTVMAISAADDPALPNEPTRTSYFRRTFNGPAEWSRATLRAYLDDEGEIYLNGQLVAQLSTTDLVTEIDVTSALRPGRNTLAVRLLNAEYDECVALELRLEPARP